MKNLEFYEIYNNFNNIKIDFENPINTLIKINGLFIKNGLRKDREKEINKLRKEIIKMFDANKDHLDIYSITKCISLMQLWQIFYDANHRTSILFFKIVMNHFEPNFNHIAKTNNDFNDFFSILYYDDEEPSITCIKKIEKYIKK